MNEMYNSVGAFNEISGSLEKIDHARISLQLRLIAEEVKECLDSHTAKDVTNVAKECSDILVTAFGLCQVLEVAGYDMGEVNKLVCNNNLSKFPTSKQLKESYPSTWQVSYNDCYEVYVIKDETLKIRKPNGYKAVTENDLQKYCPKEYVKE